MQTIQKCFTELRSHRENIQKEGTQTLWIDVNDLDYKLKTLQQRKNCRDSAPVMNQIQQNRIQENEFRGKSSEKYKSLNFKKKQSFNSQGQLITEKKEENKIQKPQQIYYEEYRRPLTQNKQKTNPVFFTDKPSLKIQSSESVYLEIPSKLLFKKQQKMNNIKVSIQNSNQQKGAVIKFNQTKQINFDSPSNKQNNQKITSSQSLMSQQFSKKQIEDKLQAIKDKINGLNFKPKAEIQKKIVQNGQNNQKLHIQNIKDTRTKKQGKNNNANSVKTVQGHTKNKSSNHISHKNIQKKQEAPMVLNPHKSQISLKQEDLQLTQSIMNRYMQAYGDNKTKSQKIQALFSQLRTIINDQ